LKKTKSSLAISDCGLSDEEAMCNEAKNDDTLILTGPPDFEVVVPPTSKKQVLNRPTVVLDLLSL
jgi:hypothetical protein